MPFDNFTPRGFYNAVRASYPRFINRMSQVPGQALNSLAEYEKQNPAGTFIGSVLPDAAGSFGIGTASKAADVADMADIADAGLTAAKSAYPATSTLNPMQRRNLMLDFINKLERLKS